MTTETREVLNAEMWMHAVRLMRSGNYTTAKALIAAMQDDFPEVPPERLKLVMWELAAKMRENA